MNPAKDEMPNIGVLRAGRAGGDVVRSFGLLDGHADKAQRNTMIGESQGRAE